MSSQMGRWMGYLIAAQLQAVTLMFMGWWAGEWLNREYPMDFNWSLVTFSVAIVAIFQSFYVILRGALRISTHKGKADESKDSGGKGG